MRWRGLLLIHSVLQVAIGITSPQGRMLAANSAFLMLLGYSRAELLEQQTTPLSFTHPDSHSAVLICFGSVLQGQQTATTQGKFCCKVKLAALRLMTDASRMDVCYWLVSACGSAWMCRLSPSMSSSRSTR